MSLGQLKVMTAIENCRTAALGGHVEACDDCGHWRIAYNSCRNRHCPMPGRGGAHMARGARSRSVAGRLLPRGVHGARRDRRRRMAEQGCGPHHSPFTHRSVNGARGFLHQDSVRKRPKSLDKAAIRARLVERPLFPEPDLEGRVVALRGGKSARSQTDRYQLSDDYADAAQVFRAWKSSNDCPRALEHG